MAVYEIRSLDVWGNATDGYEVNASFRTGDYLVVSAASTDDQKVRELVSMGVLSERAIVALQEGEDALRLDDPTGDGESITIEEFVTEEATEPNEPAEDDITTEDHQHWYQNGRLYVTGGDTQLQEQMERDSFWPNIWFISDHGNAHLITRGPDEDPRNAEMVQGWKPLYQLEAMHPPAKGLHFFWSHSPSHMGPTQYLLAIDAYQKIHRFIRHTDEPVVDDYFGEATVKEFRENDFIGILMDTMESPMGLGDRLHEEALVALDYFLENGAPDERFLNGI